MTKMTDDKMRFADILDEEIAIAKETWNGLEIKSDMIKRGALAAMSRAYELDRGVVKHKVEIIVGNLDYKTVVCSCGWKGGCWSSYENARNEVHKHERAIAEHVTPYIPAQFDRGVDEGAIEPTEEKMLKILAEECEKYKWFNTRINSFLASDEARIVIAAMRRVAAPTPPQSSRDAVIEECALKIEELAEVAECVSKQDRPTNEIDHALMRLIAFEAGIKALHALKSTPSQTAPTITDFNAMVDILIAHLFGEDEEFGDREDVVAALTAALQKAKL